MKIWKEISRTCKKSNGVYPICFPNFTMNMAAVLVRLAAMQLREDYPEFQGLFAGGGKKKTVINEQDIIDVLSGDDFPRASTVFMQAEKFLEWFSEQEAPKFEDNKIWYDYGFIVEKWNEYAEIRNEEDDDDERSEG